MVFIFIDTIHIHFSYLKFLPCLFQRRIRHYLNYCITNIFYKWIITIINHLIYYLGRCEFPYFLSQFVPVVTHDNYVYSHLQGKMIHLLNKGYQVTHFTAEVIAIDLALQGRKDGLGIGEQKNSAFFIYHTYISSRLCTIILRFYQLSQ